LKISTTTFAALTDLDNYNFVELLKFARDEERKFLIKENEIRKSNYKWPRSAVNNWGRIWEYPYVMNIINLVCEKDNISTIADVGCGITFFPLMVAKKKHKEYICC